MGAMGCEPHGQMVGGMGVVGIVRTMGRVGAVGAMGRVGDSPRTPEGGQARKRWWEGAVDCEPHGQMVGAVGASRTG